MNLSLLLLCHIFVLNEFYLGCLDRELFACTLMSPHNQSCQLVYNCIAHEKKHTLKCDPGSSVGSVMFFSRKQNCFSTRTKRACACTHRRDSELSVGNVSSSSRQLSLSINRRSSLKGSRWASEANSCECTSFVSDTVPALCL
jgi:hypothetical protein